MPCFFFTATATPDIYTLSLHDALPISRGACPASRAARPPVTNGEVVTTFRHLPYWQVATKKRRATVLRASDRKSTRLNSSHTVISYAVFCLKKKIRLYVRAAPAVPALP